MTSCREAVKVRLVMQDLRSLRTAADKADALASEARQAYLEAVRQAKESRGAVAVAAELGISRQRVYQLVSINRAGDATNAPAHGTEG